MLFTNVTVAIALPASEVGQTVAVCCYVGRNIGGKAAGQFTAPRTLEIPHPEVGRQDASAQQLQHQRGFASQCVPLAIFLRTVVLAGEGIIRRWSGACTGRSTVLVVTSHMQCLQQPGQSPPDTSIKALQSIYMPSLQQPCVCRQ